MGARYRPTWQVFEDFFNIIFLCTTLGCRGPSPLRASCSPSHARGPCGPSVGRGLACARPRVSAAAASGPPPDPRRAGAQLLGLRLPAVLHLLVECLRPHRLHHGRALPRQGAPRLSLGKDDSRPRAAPARWRLGQARAAPPRRPERAVPAPPVPFLCPRREGPGRFALDARGSGLTFLLGAVRCSSTCRRHGRCCAAFAPSASFGSSSASAGGKGLRPA